MEPTKESFISKAAGLIAVCVLFFCVVLVPFFFTSSLIYHTGEYFVINWRYDHAAWIHGLRFVKDQHGLHLSNGDPIPFGFGPAMGITWMILILPTFICSLFVWLLWSAKVQSWICPAWRQKPEPPAPSSVKIPGHNLRRLFSAVEIFVVLAIFYGIALCILHPYDTGEHPVIMSIYRVLYTVLTPMLWTYLAAVSFLLLAGPLCYRRLPFSGLKAWLTGVIGLMYLIGLVFGWWLR